MDIGGHKELDDLLYDFVEEQYSRGTIVYVSTLLSKVKEIQQTHCIPQLFCPSLSWINKFKKRYGFTDKQITNDLQNKDLKELSNGPNEDRSNSIESSNDSQMEASQFAEILERKEEMGPPNKQTKREDYICWADYFMAVASLTALRSKDPNSQVGACIVNEENKIVGVGYNGMPNGCSDDILPWAREADDVLETKYPYVCHAEMNAICNKNCADLKGCTIYVALFPCNECAKLIIQSRIKEVVYMSDKYHNTPNVIASKKLFDMSGVMYRQHTPTHSKIVIDLNKINNSAQSCNEEQ